MDWDPKQYEKFLHMREAPFVDLLAHVARRPRMRVVDLGCGPGNLTRQLADALDGADVIGVDNSAAMLARAQSEARPGLRLRQQSIEEFAFGSGEEFARSDEKFDLIFSNAALHWVDEHEKLIPALLARLAPGGQIAVQLPSDDYNAMRATFAEAAGWRHRMGTLDIAAYATLLFEHGAREELLVYEKIYPHVVADADAVLEWGKGTALLPYLAPLDDAGRRALLDDVRARLWAKFPAGPLFFPFRRTIFSARRA
jgi:trans-aconitate 2-methyltransferase